MNKIKRLILIRATISGGITFFANIFSSNWIFSLTAGILAFIIANSIFTFTYKYHANKYHDLLLKVKISKAKSETASNYYKSIKPKYGLKDLIIINLDYLIIYTFIPIMFYLINQDWDVLLDFTKELMTNNIVWFIIVIFVFFHTSLLIAIYKKKYPIFYILLFLSIPLLLILHFFGTILFSYSKDEAELFKAAAKYAGIFFTLVTAIEYFEDKIIPKISKSNIIWRLWKNYVGFISWHFLDKDAETIVNSKPVYVKLIEIIDFTDIENEKALVNTINSNKKPSLRRKRKKRKRK
jgi:hypothetical protein